MSWTYSGDPSASDADAVRFLVGDVDENADQTLTDQEIDYLVASWPGVHEAAAAAAEALAGRYGSQASFSKTVGQLSLSKQYQDQAASFMALAGRLRSQSLDLDPPRPWVKPGAIQTARERDNATPTTEFIVGGLDNRRAITG